MRPQPYTQEDFSVNPLMFYYEVTQACDLVCKHCRASAQENAAPDELPTETALALLEDVARFPRKPTICFTGGDPLKRADLFDLIRHATELGIGSALTPSATPLATFVGDPARHVRRVQKGKRGRRVRDWNQYRRAESGSPRRVPRIRRQL